MKKIWIIDHYSSEPKHFGISRQYDFARELSVLGYQVIVIASSFSHFTHSYISEKELYVSEVNSKVHYVYVKTSAYQSNGGLARIKNIFSFRRSVLHHYREIAARFGKPDVVTGCSVHPLAWTAAYRIARNYKIRFVAEVRDLWPEMWLLNGEKKPYDPMVLFFGALERWAYRKADRIIYSMAHGDRYICGKLGFPKEKTALIGQPMDCERYDFNAAHNHMMIPQEIRDFVKDSFYCVFTGYYMTYEGVYPMLEAARLLQKDELPVKMVFVGSGKEKEGMTEYVRGHQLDNVLVADRISKEAIPALLRGSRICLAHCSTEGRPQSFRYGVSKNKVNEYFYANSCIIYGFADPDDAVATSGAGYIVTPFDALSFYQRIKEVYLMPEEERMQFGRCGREYIEQNHKVQILAKKLAEVLFGTDGPQEM